VFMVDFSFGGGSLAVDGFSFRLASSSSNSFRRGSSTFSTPRWLDRQIRRLNSPQNRIHTTNTAIPKTISHTPPGANIRQTKNTPAAVNPMLSGSRYHQKMVFDRQISCLSWASKERVHEASVSFVIGCLRR